MNVLLILNDPPTGSGRSDNGLRVAAALLRAEDANVRLFLLGDAVSWAAAPSRDAAAQHPVNPVSALINTGCVVAVSDVGMRDRGIAQSDLVIGAEPATSSTLAAWCLESERLLVF
jgi:uncharacterized protein involved in oxidation of intracellular sulfur